jgi:hypothetical protein
LIQAYAVFAGRLIEERIDEGIVDQQDAYLNPGGAGVGDKCRGGDRLVLTGSEDSRCEFGGVQSSESCSFSSLALSVIAASHSQ